MVSHPMMVRLGTAAMDGAMTVANAGQNAVQGAKPLKPQVGPAQNIGPKLKILKPSSMDSEMSAWESMVSTCLVKDLNTGYVVVKLEGESFEKIDPNADVDMYVVTAKDPCILKDIKSDAPVCIRNPEQEIHVLNQYGLSSLDKVSVENAIYPVVLSAPGLYERQQLVAKSSTVVVNAPSVAPKKPELIFNFMGFVWGTNDPNSNNQKWMGEVGNEVKTAAKDAVEDAKDAAALAVKEGIADAKKKAEKVETIE